MAGLRQLAASGGRLVLSFQGTALAEIGSTNRSIEVRGMLQLALEVTGLQFTARVERFGLTSPGVAEGADDMGTLGMESIDPGSARLRFAHDLQSATLDFSFVTDAFYDALLLRQREIDWSEDMKSVEYERFRCEGQGRIRLDGDRLLFDGALDWRRSRKSAALLTALHMQAVAVRVDLALATKDELQPGVHRLEIQPIGFRVHPNDPDHSAQTAATQTAYLTQIWGNCCLELIVHPLWLIDDPIRKTTTKISQVPSAREFCYAVRAYFIDAQIPEDAKTFGFGMGNARVVISDQNTTNPSLLAHEFGHVLRGDHPGTTDGLLWSADTGTVLEVGDPNPAANSVKNCQKARNGGFAWIDVPCTPTAFP